ncbi:AMP-binding protein [bacterium]|nr:AMP-binding protein [bacterium]
MKTLLDLIYRSAQIWPEQNVLEYPTGESINYKDFLLLIETGTQRLKKSGLGLGDHVALLAKNSFQSAAAYFSVISLGGVVVPINYSLDSSAISEVIATCDPKLIIAESALRNRITLKAEYKTIDASQLSKSPPSNCYRKNQIQISEDNLASIVFTSGSEGHPLGVMLSHKNLLSNTTSIAQYMKLTDRDRILCVLPLYYIYGLSLLLSHIAVGGTTILENRFMFPQVVAESLKTSDATGFAGVSTHYHVLMQKTDFPETAYPSLRYFQHAGDKMPTSTSAGILKAFPGKELYLMYGQTEAAPRLSFLCPTKASAKLASSGQGIPGVTLKTVRENGTQCAVNEEGELLAKGSNIMIGYFNEPVETKKVIKNEWLHTGDMAYVDTEGDIFITGRKKQFLKVGGRRIPPSEIEKACLELPLVREAAAIGISDLLLGQRVKVFLSVSEEIEKKQVLAELRKRLPTYMVPAEIEFISELPKKSNGKVDRNQLI